MSDWISTKQNLPPLHEPVLALFNGNPIVLELAEETPSWEETFDAFRYWVEPSSETLDIDWDEVTHWMPIPRPPEVNHES